MVEFSIFNKNVPVAPKTKRGRKSKAAKEEQVKAIDDVKEV